jgi:hypothetical protein
MSNAASRDAPPGSYVANHGDGTLTLRVEPMGPARDLRRLRVRAEPDGRARPSLFYGFFGFVFVGVAGFASTSVATIL